MIKGITALGACAACGAALFGSAPAAGVVKDVHVAVGGSDANGAIVHGASDWMRMSDYEPVLVDGSISVPEYGPPLATQNVATGFGDADGMNPGSELDALFARRQDDGSLALAVTGNLEGNGNSLVIFLDCQSGGAVAEALTGGYGQLGSIGGQRCDDWGTDNDGSDWVNPTPGGGSVLWPGFNPDFAIEVNTPDGFSYYVNIIDLHYPNDDNLPNKDVYLGSNYVNGGAVSQGYWRDGGATFAGTITHALVNANTAGVLGYDWSNPPGPLGDPLSATTGFEIVLGADFLQANVASGHAIKAMAFLTNSSGDYLSNQFLPGLGDVMNLGAAGDLGGAPLFDARLFAGPGFVLLTPANGDINGDGYTNILDLQTLVTAWASHDGGSPSGNWNVGADLNDDGYVNVGDLQILVANWGR